MKRTADYRETKSVVHAGKYVPRERLRVSFNENR